MENVPTRREIELSMIFDFSSFFWKNSKKTGRFPEK